MKLTIKHIHHTPSASLKTLISTSLEAICKARRIDEAHITVENLLDASPAFRIAAYLVTPGLDLFAEQRDHTLRAALLKTVEVMESELSRRSKKQKQKPSAVRGKLSRLN